MNTSVFLVVGQGRCSGIQKPLVDLFHYGSDGVEGLGWEVWVRGSRSRYHHGELRLLAGKSLSFVDREKRPCEISFEFVGKPGMPDFSASYKINTLSESGSVLDEDGTVLFGAETLYKVSQGTLFSYIQTPD